jgi:hypothetical protein
LQDHFSFKSSRANPLQFIGGSSHRKGNGVNSVHPLARGVPSPPGRQAGSGGPAAWPQEAHGLLDCPGHEVLQKVEEMSPAARVRQGEADRLKAQAEALAV